MATESAPKKLGKEKSVYGGIFALLVIIVLFVLFQFTNIFSPRMVKGIKTDRTRSLADQQKVQKAKENLEESIQERLEHIKQQVANLQPEDILQDSVQFQRIIEDLRGLQRIPRSQLKQTCESICQKL
jgi:TolA-binding protein